MGLTILGPEGNVASAARDWHDAHWDLVLGCTRVSPGCAHCTAEYALADHRGHPGYARRTGHGPRWTGRVDVRPGALSVPARLAPSRLLTCGIADLFHEQVPDQFLDRVFAAMDHYPQHRFAVLTKRSARMRAYLRGRRLPRHVWPGVTVEDCKRRSRIHDLLEVDAAFRWVSAEPLLEDLGHLAPLLGPEGVAFVAAGPEIGPHRRSCDAAWMRSLRDQCRDHGALFFTKHLLDGQSHRQIPPF